MQSKFLASAILSGFLALFAMAPALGQAPPTPPPVSVLSGYATLSVTATTGRVALPSTNVSASALTLYNSGAKDAFFKLGSSTVTAATTDIIIPAGVSFTIWRGPTTNTNIAAICGGSDTTTLLVFQANGPIGFVH